MKETQLINLYRGQQFKIPGLDNCYKNLKLVRVNKVSAVISGERKLKVNDKDVWVTIPGSYTISPYTVVEPI
jgi:predicted ATP-dependent serine protease